MASTRGHLGPPNQARGGRRRSALEEALLAESVTPTWIGAEVMRVTPGPGPTDWHYEPRQPRLDVLAGSFRRGGS